MTTKRLGFWLAVGAAILAFDGTAQAQEAGTIKIGSVLSVTGPAAYLGDPEERTLRLYVDQINGEGGVLGKQLELVVYDDGGDPSKAKTFAQRLVEEDEVVAMLGGTSTGTTMAMIPVFEDAEVPFISFAGGSRSSSRSTTGCSRRPRPTAWPASGSSPR